VYLVTCKLLARVFIIFQDMSTLDLDEFRHKGANITSMRLIDPNNPDVMSIMAEWGIMETNNLRSPLLGMRAIKVMFVYIQNIQIETSVYSSHDYLSLIISLFLYCKYILFIGIFSTIFPLR
jgi:hypothetical protein